MTSDLKRALLGSARGGGKADAMAKMVTKALSAGKYPIVFSAPPLPKILPAAIPYGHMFENLAESTSAAYNSAVETGEGLTLAKFENARLRMEQVDVRPRPKSIRMNRAFWQYCLDRAADGTNLRVASAREKPVPNLLDMLVEIDETKLLPVIVFDDGSEQPLKGLHHVL